MLHNLRHKPPRPFWPKPKSQRLEKRRYVTLIAAIRCYEGAVLCADTMETVEGFRSPVHKIEPRECGEYWLAVAGTGHADLVDGFTELLRLNIEQWKPGYTDQVIWALLRETTRDYHENEVKLYPEDSEREKAVSFIVCIKPKNVIGLSLWEIRGPIVTPIGDYALLGYASAMYKYELKRLFEANNAMVGGKAVNRFGRVPALLLGIHLFTLAKDTSTYIGGDTDAIYVFDDNHMKAVDPEDIKLLEERVSRFDNAIAEIAIKCPDTTNADIEVRTYLLGFVDRVMEMRERSANQAAHAGIKAILRNAESNVDPYLHIPRDHAIEWHFDTDSVTIKPKDKDNPEPGPIKRKKPGRGKRSKPKQS